ncbi:TraV family lipoprotein [Pseudoduganella umbonata]|uniref:Conjugal transfer pilus assembly protein TraV n=1 Tax=Pseudoduganella umbonata TaxID=864828 RepID=A0A4V1ECX2_9BURK|nr:TraV family lipoprotein [Pseudoduganella umbonata]MBB3221708.1 conjugal transfer pilus assembly protein TraV [Pseudoduganella umbonata]QCP09071.1 TraV family lipoprotein [Pseudoduganella umbonata]
MRLHLYLIAVVATGCQPLTGIIGARESFACKAPDGVACSSVSGVHANLHAHNLPFQRQGATHMTTTPSPTGTALAMPVAGDPLRSEGRTLRIWLAPWIDSDETLHDQAFLYTQVGEGRWQIGELRERLAKRPRPPVDAPTPLTPIAARQVTVPSSNPSKPLANVRKDGNAQAAARATVEATRQQEQAHE